MISTDCNLEDINLLHEHKLYESIMHMTKICALCNKNMCPGGKNCRNGAMSIQYKICYDDFVYGNCKRVGCQCAHLTKKGLVPYSRQKNRTKVVYKKEVLLIEHFLMSSSKSNMSDSETDESVDEIIKYLNNDDSSSDESIFLV